MSSLHRLVAVSLLLSVNFFAHAEPQHLVVRLPAYPAGEMPDKEKVMSTLASYAFWPAEQRPVPPSQLYAEYAKYCKARWALTAWNLRDSTYLIQIKTVRKALFAWSGCLAPVMNSRTGCLGGAYYREFWANDMRLEDALARAVEWLPGPSENEFKVEHRVFERLEDQVWAIPSYERAPGGTSEDDPVNAKDFAKNKFALIQATKRLNAALQELPSSAAYPILKEMRRTLTLLHE